MNYLHINELSDLQFILEEPLYISGQPSLIKEEIYHNMWAISFSDELTKNLKIQSLIEKFLSALLNQRTSQLFDIDPQQEAIFYIWFDGQALQLCFNFISNCHNSLPFRAKLNILDSYEPIINKFLTEARHVMAEGRFFEIFEPGESPYDDDDETEEEYIVNVYMQIIGPKLNI